MGSGIKILMTGGGAPQAPTLIRHLRENGERPVTLVAMDMNPEACGRWMADKFHVIPPAGTAGYEDALIRIIQDENPDALLNVCGTDVLYISAIKERLEALGPVVICSDASAIEIANDKFKLFSTLNEVDGVNVPEFINPVSLDEFVSSAYKMGYPKRNLCFKPHISKGSRGFRVLSEQLDRRDLLLNKKPTSLYMTLDEFTNIFKDAAQFPKLLLMEVATGEEIDLMTIAYDGEALLTTCKTRESHRWGIIDRGELVKRPELEKSASQIINKIRLSYNISIQFIGGKIIEINPRTSTFIYQEDLNEPWLAIKLALGLIGVEELREYKSRIRYGRRMVRFMDQIFFDPDGNWSY
jgi:carbamoyl-phosphate synthase large subunit